MGEARHGRVINTPANGECRELFQDSCIQLVPQQLHRCVCMNNVWTGRSQLSPKLCHPTRNTAAHGLASVQVTDLGQVLHMVGGTAASYMIFFLPGMLLLNAAIVKRTASMADFESAQVRLLAAYAWKEFAL